MDPAPEPPPDAAGGRAAPDEPSDAAIVARSLETPTQFSALFDRHAPAIHRYLARRAGAQVADDLVGANFLVAFERRAAYDLHHPDARPWLYGIASNLLGRHRRDEQRMLRAYTRAGAGSDVDDGADRAVARVEAALCLPAVATAVAALSSGDRDVLLLFALAPLSYAEIAQALDIPVGTVRSRLNRAQHRTRAALGADATVARFLTEESSHG